MIAEQVDVERLVTEHLRADAGVAAIIDRRIVAHPPRDQTLPWVMVTLLDQPQASSVVDHLAEAYLQLDCYAGAEGGQPEANRLMRATRRAIADIAGTHDAGVATGSRVNSRRLDDEDFEPPRSRYIVTVTVWVHP